MIYLIYLFLAAGIFLIVFGFAIPRSNTVPALERLPIEASQVKKLKKQIYLAPLLRLSSRVLEKLKLEGKMRHSLHAAHTKLTPQEFFIIKILLVLALTTAAFFIFKGMPQAVLIVFVFSYLIPDFWLKKRIANYKESVARCLPETVDLLGLCLEAGLDFTAAIDWIIKKTKHTPVVEELAFVLEEIKWGKPRAQALKDMAKKLDIPELSSFSQILVQAERLGTPVGEVFNILSEDTRLQRYRKGERIALKAPIKMLIPLIFCILPVIGIVIGGPILLQFMQGGMLKGF